MRSNEKFTQRAESAIENARAEAAALGHSFVGSEHLLLGILSEPDALGERVLRRCGAEPETLRRLAARGVPFDSEEMLRAYERFTELDKQWRELERKHLALREEIAQKPGK